MQLKPLSPPLSSQDEANRKVFGYARVSTDDQSLDMQLSALNNAGCDRIFQEKKSVTGKRYQFDVMLKNLRRGDILVVWKLDRLNRDLLELARLAKKLDKEGIELQSLTENIDTSTAMGKMAFQMLGVFAELERNIISERTKAGIAIFKERGGTVGRRSRFTGELHDKVKTDLEDVSQRVVDVAKKYKTSPTTLNQRFPGVRRAALAKLGR